MSAGHDHGKGANERAMWIALVLTGGLLTGSLALLSDAAGLRVRAGVLTGGEAEHAHESNP